MRGPFGERAPNLRGAFRRKQSPRRGKRLKEATCRFFPLGSKSNTSNMVSGS